MRAFIEDIVKANPDVIVVVDEAYIDFGGISALPLIKKYDNLLVVQTFSKSRAMAGIRIGYAFGCEKLIKYLSDVKFSFNSYTMNRPALSLGVEAVRDDAYFKEIVGKIVNTREWVKKELKELGFVFKDSMSNFIFATHPDYDIVNIFEEAGYTIQKDVLNAWNYGVAQKRELSEKIQLTELLNLMENERE